MAARANALLATSAQASVRALTLQATATRELSLGNYAAAASARAQAFAAQAQATGSAKLATIFFSMSTGIAGAARGFLALGGAMLTSPIALITAAVALLSQAFSDFAEADNAKKALDEIARSSAGVIDSIRKQAAAVQSLDDAYDALNSTNARLKDAQKAAAEHDPGREQPGLLDSALQQLSGKGEWGQVQAELPETKDDVSWWNPIGKWAAARSDTRKAARGEGEAKRSQAFDISDERAKQIADIRSGRLTSRGQDAVVARQAVRQLGVEEELAQQRIGAAAGPEKLRLMREHTAGERARYEAGAGLEEARAKFDADSAAANAQFGAGSTRAMQSIEAAALGSASPLVRNEQIARNLRSSGHLDTARKWETANARDKADLEDNRQRHLDAATAGPAQEQAEARQQHLAQIGLDAARQEAALRSEGLARTEEEARIRIEAAQKEMEAAHAHGDTQGAEGARNRIAAEEQALALAQKRAAIERAADESHLRVLELEQRSAGLALAGRFAESDAAKKAALRESDAGANRESYRQKTLAGYSPEDARAAVGREQAQRAGGRALQAEAFRQSEGRQLKERELARRRRPGDARLGQRMADEDAVRGYLKKAQDAGIYGDEAADFARRSASADIHDQVQAAGAANRPIVSSLARIGGGGNVDTNNFNALREEAVRQRQLLEIIAQNTKNPMGAGQIR